MKLIDVIRMRQIDRQIDRYLLNERYINRIRKLDKKDRYEYSQIDKYEYIWINKCVQNQIGIK